MRRALLVAVLGLAGCAPRDTDLLIEIDRLKVRIVTLEKTNAEIREHWIPIMNNTSIQLAERIIALEDRR